LGEEKAVSRIEWGALTVVLGLVLSLQVVGHGGEEDHHEHVSPIREAPVRPTSGSPESGARADMFRSVTLEVRGMM